MENHVLSISLFYRTWSWFKGSALFFPLWRLISNGHLLSELFNPEFDFCCNLFDWNDFVLKGQKVLIFEHFIFLRFCVFPLKKLIKATIFQLYAQVIVKFVILVVQSNFFWVVLQNWYSSLDFCSHYIFWALGQWLSLFIVCLALTLISILWDLGSRFFGYLSF